MTASVHPEKISDGATITWRRILAGVPMRNQAVEVLDQGMGQIRVIVERQKPWFIFPPISWFIPFNTRKNIHLDEVGTELWKRCDGKSSVEEIVDFFADRHRLTFHESRVAVTAHLKNLMQRGIIAVAEKKVPAG